MDKLKITGKNKLQGYIKVHGAKNSALPILVASLLNKKNLALRNIPDVDDISNMLKLLKSYGSKIKKNKNSLVINNSKIQNISADYDIVRKMRASILLLGPLLSRFGYAKISLPGGCAIGTRPIDIHLKGLSKLGVSFDIENGFVVGKVKTTLKGNKINLPFPSVGATENIMMSAVLAKGETLLLNSAKEPEIQDLGNCLNSMGAKISGHGSDKIIIQGVETLESAEYEIISDRIVAGTYIILAIMLNSSFEVKKFNPKHIIALIKVLKKMGANISVFDNSIKINPSKNLRSCNVVTGPYPKFPTDLQAQLMALMSIVDGISNIKETIFENRFMHVPELNRLGANIKLSKDNAKIEGNQIFKGAQVMASDLRASVSLILAALCADGITTINRVYHLDRGYEKIEKTIGKLGPKIKRLKT